jgi:hypothetical protein
MVSGALCECGQHVSLRQLPLEWHGRGPVSAAPVAHGDRGRDPHAQRDGLGRAPATSLSAARGARAGHGPAVARCDLWRSGWRVLDSDGGARYSAGMCHAGSTVPWVGASSQP